VTAEHLSREDFRLLTPEAFEFVLNNELKRAVRSQTFLTLVLLGSAAAASEPAALRELASVVSRELRETDLISATPEGRLSVVLLDADLQSSLRVIDRLVAGLQPYRFSTPMDLAVGAACCPTHGADAASLRRVAEAHPIRPIANPRDAASAQQG
jgi:hypothetical protein